MKFITKSCFKEFWKLVKLATLTKTPTQGIIADNQFDLSRHRL